MPRYTVELTRCIACACREVAVNSLYHRMSTTHMATESLLSLRRGPGSELLPPKVAAMTSRLCARCHAAVAASCANKMNIKPLLKVVLARCIRIDRPAPSAKIALRIGQPCLIPEGMEKLSRRCPLWEIVVVKWSQRPEIRTKPIETHSTKDKPDPAIRNRSQTEQSLAKPLAAEKTHEEVPVRDQMGLSAPLWRPLTIPHCRWHTMRFAMDERSAFAIKVITFGAALRQHSQPQLYNTPADVFQD